MKNDESASNGGAPSCRILETRGESNAQTVLVLLSLLELAQREKHTIRTLSRSEHKFSLSAPRPAYAPERCTQGLPM